MGEVTLPLIKSGAGTAIVAWRHGNPISQEHFLGDVSVLAERVPQRRFAINLCEDRYAFAVAFCAALLRGQISLLPPDRNLKTIVEIAGRYPDHYFLDGGESPVRQTADSLLPLTSKWVDCSVTGDRTTASSKFMPHVPASQTAAILFTSGSTGTPRPHSKRWDSLTTVASLQYAYLRRLRARLSGVLATVPPQHMYGLEASVMLPLQSGLPMHSDQPLFPEDVRRAIAVCGAAPLLVTTPIHLRALTRARLHYQTCGLVLSATAPLDKELAVSAERKFGCALHEVYGSTETGAVASRRTVDGPLWAAYPGIRLVTNGVRTAHALADHLPTPVPLMDRIELVDSGRFELFDRLDDMLNIAGKHASLSDLNRNLLAIPGVDDGTMFLLDTEPSAPPRLGAMVVASGMDAATISAALRQSADPVFLPRRIIFVERLPRNKTGKLRRDALRFCWQQGTTHSPSVS